MRKEEARTQEKEHEHPVSSWSAAAKGVPPRCSIKQYAHFTDEESGV